MYITIKKLATVCGILTAVNCLMTILLTFAIPTFQLSFAFGFTVGTLLVTISLALLLLTIALRNIYDLLELDYENIAGKIREIDKKLSKIEEKV